MTLDTIKQILTFDVQNAYFTLGNKILRQTLGIPMGSPCSPAFAVAVCMKAEHDFSTTHPDVKIIKGFRYIDDLLLFLKQPCDAIMHMYPPPLELESELTLDGHIHKIKFLETWTELDTHTGSFTIIHALKQWIRELQGKPPLRNITSFDSHVPPHQKFGLAVGTLLRAARNSLGHTAQTVAKTRAMAALFEHNLSMRTACNAEVRVRNIEERNKRNFLAGSPDPHHSSV